MFVDSIFLHPMFSVPFLFLLICFALFPFLAEQAYTNELELQVAHLMEENARLKKQQEPVIFFPSLFFGSYMVASSRTIRFLYLADIGTLFPKKDRLFWSFPFEFYSV